MKKLSLNRETLRALDAAELQAVHGGQVVLIDDGTRSDTGGGGGTGESNCPSYCIANPCGSGNWTDCASCQYSGCG